MSFLDKLATHSTDLFTTECLTLNLVNQKVLCVFTAGHRACLPHIYATKVDFSCYSSQSFKWIFLFYSYQKAAHIFACKNKFNVYREMLIVSYASRIVYMQ